MLSQEAKGFLLDHPDQFILHYFRDRIEKLETFHQTLIHSATGEDLALVLYPAGHGKTTLVSTLLPIWAVCKDPNTRVAVIQKNATEAHKVSLAIKGSFSNEELVKDFGPFRPEGEDKPWAATQMSVVKRTLIAKEPTIAYFGSGSKDTLGTRANWVICDDVVTADNSSTPTQQENLREWFNISVTTMGLPGARLTVVGTLFDPNDLYNDIIEMVDPETGLPIYHVDIFDAIKDEENHETLWPEFWPWRKLMQQKAVAGTLDFNKRYRNIAVDKSRMVFREEYIKGSWDGKIKYPGCIDRNFTIGSFDERWKRIAGFDPAIGATRSAKFCAHITLGLGSCSLHERCIWVIDLYREQLSLPQQVDQILYAHSKYNLHKSVVEANAYQAGLLEAVQSKMQESGLAYSIEPHLTSRITKHDPEIGIGSMSPWFENGQVHIPYGNPESIRKMQIFIDELIQYPGRTTDTVMAFWFAWKILQEQIPKYKSTNYLKKPMIWGTRPGHRVVKNPHYV